MDVSGFDKVPPSTNHLAAVMTVGIDLNSWRCLDHRCPAIATGPLNEHRSSLLTSMSRHWKEIHKRNLKLENVIVRAAVEGVVVEFAGNRLMEWVSTDRSVPLEKFTELHWNWSEILEKTQGSPNESLWRARFEKLLMKNTRNEEFMKRQLETIAEQYERDEGWTSFLKSLVEKITPLNPPNMELSALLVSKFFIIHLKKHRKFPRPMDRELHKACTRLMQGSSTQTLVYIRAIEMVFAELSPQQLDFSFGNTLDVASTYSDPRVAQLATDLEKRLDQMMGRDDDYSDSE